MSGMHISDLPELALGTNTEITFPVVSGGANSRLSMDRIIIMLRDEFSPGKAVIRCSSCGQWGARFCECRKCGAPIE